MYCYIITTYLKILGLLFTAMYYLMQRNWMFGGEYNIIIIVSAFYTKRSKYLVFRFSSPNATSKRNR